MFHVCFSPGTARKQQVPDVHVPKDSKLLWPVFKYQNPHVTCFLFILYFYICPRGLYKGIIEIHILKTFISTKIKTWHMGLTAVLYVFNCVCFYIAVRVWLCPSPRGRLWTCDLNGFYWLNLDPNFNGIIFHFDHFNKSWVHVA